MNESTYQFEQGNQASRWLMLALVWLLYASFGITQGSIPPVAGLVIEDLGITYSQMGLVLGFWQLVYIGTSLPLGHLVDRLGVRRSLGIGILFVWFSLCLRGLAPSFTVLLFAVALFGIGGPIISIGAPKVVSMWFRSEDRGLAAGIYTTGPLAGSAIALATAASLVLPLTGSWRGIAPVYGTIVFLVMAAWWILAKDINQPSSTPRPKHSGYQIFRRIAKIPTVRVVLVLAVGSFFMSHGLMAWTPSVLQERGMTLSQAGWWSAAGTAAGAVGLILLPLAGRYISRPQMLRLLFVVSATSNLGLIMLRGSALVGALILSNIARAPLMPLLILILMETPGVGSVFMGAAAGLFFSAAEIGGVGGPLVLGVTRDMSGSLDLGVLTLVAVAVVMIFVVPLVRENQTKGNVR
ncbi:MAG: MFS transporter [SAR202 cluster bacterium]|nr:MFS transporter [SAR202 cluster bacterium]